VGPPGAAEKGRGEEARGRGGGALRSRNAYGSSTPPPPPHFPTCTGLRFAPLPSAGGASAPRRRKTTSSRCVRRMEDAAEDSVGGGAEGDREIEEPVDGPRSAGRWKMWAGSAELPLLQAGRGRRPE